jgi:AraC family transcriptional regulator, regulatory protein of adaptative response / methylated-DNA-[protein]-cysteine methyltransferase
MSIRMSDLDCMPDHPHRRLPNAMQAPASAWPATVGTQTIIFNRTGSTEAARILSPRGLRRLDGTPCSDDPALFIRENEALPVSVYFRRLSRRVFDGSGEGRFKGAWLNGLPERGISTRLPCCLLDLELSVFRCITSGLGATAPCGPGVVERNERAMQGMTTIDNPRWTRIMARDATADGEFWFSVTTTGIYCRPSCPARRANPDNVTIHDTLDHAKATGARACRRCDPDAAASLRDKLAARICRAIEAAETPPSLTALARAEGLGPTYLQRAFQAATGMSPKAYADAVRARRVRARLADGARVTDAVYDAGFGSATRFYDRAEALLGMAPARFRDGGRGERLRFAIGEGSLGTILVASSDRGIAAILLGDGPDAVLRDLQGRFSKAELIGGDAHYEALVAQVVAFVDRPNAGLGLPLDIRGTLFQQRVWAVLQAIPPGTTTTYAEIAQAIGAPRAVRAVAGACAANPLAVAVPCHRVVRRDGALSGYAWGIERKRALLAIEAPQADM